MTIIVGGGLSGLIAAHCIPGAKVFERSERGQMHSALLRFRSDAVSKATDIPFKRVKVRKGLWHGEFVQPNIRLCNLYAQKVTGTIGERSIWNLDPVERFIAPPDFYDKMLNRLGKRVEFGVNIDLGSPGDSDVALDPEENLISTVPMPTLLDTLKIDRADIEFSFAPIYTITHELPGVDVYQTVYFPTHCHGLYRASITGSSLILEFVDDTNGEAAWIPDVVKAFSLDDRVAGELRNKLCDAEMKSGIVHTQRYGKIVPLQSAVRRSLLLYVTAKFNIYSLGRFATWRNILLDDIVNDAQRVQDMMKADHYESKLLRGSHASHTD